MTHRVSLSLSLLLTSFHHYTHFNFNLSFLRTKYYKYLIVARVAKTKENIYGPNFYTQNIFLLR